MDVTVLECRSGMEKRVQGLDRELLRVRTGRASINLLDGVRVNYYGSPTPLNQVATLATPDARTLVISPFEKSLIGEIERGIQIADLGIQPVNDGQVIRLNVPPLNEERRREIAKTIRKTGEDAKVGVRKVRQDTNGQLKKREKAKELSSDESKQLQKEVQELTDEFIKTVDARIAKKEGEILTL